MSTRPPWPIVLPEGPLSPWLRLAHVYQYRQAHENGQARLRVLDDFELIFQLGGSSWVWSDEHGGSVDIDVGSVVLLPPDFPHGWGESGVHVAVHFDLHAQPELQSMRNIRVLDRVVERSPLAFMPQFELVESASTQPIGQPSVIQLVTRTGAPGLWHERLMPLVELWNRRITGSLEAQLRTAEVIGWALRTLSEEALREQGGETRADSRILELVRTLDLPGAGEFGKRPSVEELAASLHMSLTSFRAAFTRTMGRSPHRYFEERRVEHAARALIETDWTVTEIARAEGYDDPYHFSRVFRRVTGESPSQHRTQARLGIEAPPVAAESSLGED